MSDRPGQEVSEYERQYRDGSDPQVLDIVRIPVLGPKPQGWQSENWLLDAECYWEKEGVYSWFDLPALVDPVAPLWRDGHHSYHGANDRIPGEAMASLSDSLRFLHIERLTLHVFSPGEAFGTTKRRVQGQFRHAGRDYALWVTDPIYERRYLARLDGRYRLRDCYATVSLGEPFHGTCYKLIAAILELPR